MERTGGTSLPPASLRLSPALAAGPAASTCVSQAVGSNGCGMSRGWPVSVLCQEHHTCHWGLHKQYCHLAEGRGATNSTRTGQWAEETHGATTDPGALRPLLTCSLIVSKKNATTTPVIRERIFQNSGKGVSEASPGNVLVRIKTKIIKVFLLLLYLSLSRGA